MMSALENRKHPNPVWRFFCSVRLTVVLLILLALVSIAGTLIPQREAAMAFARSLSPATLKIFLLFDFFDIYHAVWFRLLIGILALNLVICSINRFSGIWKRFTALPRPDRQKPFEDQPGELSFLVPGEWEAVAGDVEQIFGKRYRRVRTKASGDVRYLTGERGRFTNFGFYLIHLSILIILIGALIGSLFGFEAFVNIVEGGEVDRATSTRNMAPVALGFTVRCDHFSVQFYDNGTPKEYRSDLTFLKDGKTLANMSTLVNHPARFQGMAFYQASYGMVVGDHCRLEIFKTGSTSATSVVEAEKGVATPLPDSKEHFRVTDMRENFMNMGPAVLIRIQPVQGGEMSFWVFQDQDKIEKKLPGFTHQFSKLNPSAFKPYTFRLLNVDTRYYTGLQIAKDPGVFLVWTGCFLMVGGFFVTFFMSHRRIWIRIARDKTATRISLAGTASKNPVGLDRELSQLARGIADHMAGQGREAA